MALDTPTLEITNEADDGAVTATISDGDAEATNLVRYARLTGELGELAWSNLGARIGDGEVEGTIAPGHYLWHCISTLAGESVISSLVFQPITSGDEPMHERILAAVAERATLALAGTQYTVQRFKVPLEGNVTLPACIVTAFEQTETDEGGTSAHDYIGRPVMLSLVSNDLHDEDDESSLHMARQLLRRAFSRRLPGVDEVLRCTIEPSPVLLQIQEGTEYQQSTYVVRCVSREPVGLTA